MRNDTLFDTTLYTIHSMSNATSAPDSNWRDAVPKDRFAHLIRDLARTFTRSLSLRLERHDIPIGYWTFLRVLWETDGLTQKELSDRVGVMEPTTFAAVSAMEGLNFVERKQQLPNRKNVYVWLTREGRALKKKLVPLAVETNEQVARGISAADLVTTRKVLLTMLENLQSEEISAKLEKTAKAAAVRAGALRTRSGGPG